MYVDRPSPDLLGRTTIATAGYAQETGQPSSLMARSKYFEKPDKCVFMRFFNTVVSVTARDVATFLLLFYHKYFHASSKDCVCVLKAYSLPSMCANIHRGHISNSASKITIRCHVGLPRKATQVVGVYALWLCKQK